MNHQDAQVQSIARQFVVAFGYHNHGAALSGAEDAKWARIGIRATDAKAQLLQDIG